MRKLFFYSMIVAVLTTSCTQKKTVSDCSGGWEKYEKNPVLGGPGIGTCFDISVLKDDSGKYIMYSSWRDKGAIAISESSDGLTWTNPVVCLDKDTTISWESNDINRPVVIKKDGIYHMWFSGAEQIIRGKEYQLAIGYATSTDGRNWAMQSNKPVLKAELPWEKGAVMCPHVNWDEQEKIYKMWYSGGEWYEPDAIGYATSTDGLNWKKYEKNPVFRNNKENEWEQAKVTACQVIKRENDYLMLYIGFRNTDFAQVGMAKSKDGITNWDRFKENPIIKPSVTGWDSLAVYKPYAVPDPANDRWLLYYNGRNNQFERIGIVIHKGLDLGF